MNEKQSRAKSVFGITEREERSYWVRVGVAFANKDGSVTIQLDALPVSGRLQIRTDEERDRREPR